MKIIFYHGNFCPVCDTVKKEFEDMGYADLLEIKSAENNLDEIKGFTDDTNLPIISWRDKKGNLYHTSGFIDGKQIKKIVKQAIV